MSDEELKRLLKGLLEDSSKETDLTETPTEAAVASGESPEALTRLQRHALYLQTASQVSRAVSSILDLDQLLPQVVDLIGEQFGFYYVGLFMTDEGRAVLQAGTGDAGRQMVEQGHSLQVGDDSMIGWCIAHQQARIALDVGEEAIRFDNPLLPETRSEMALPLTSRGRVLGAMTIQSTAPDAFSAEDISILQTMADQLANAIENARLFHERERRITELAMVNEIGQALALALTLDELLELVYQQVSRLFDTTNFYIATYREGDQEWTLAFHLENGQRQPLARHHIHSGLTGQIIRQRQPVLLRSEADNLAFKQAHSIEIIGQMARSWLGVPLVTRDRLVGVMAIQNYEHEQLYTGKDLSLFSTIGAQVATALDNLRLFEETRRRAEEMGILHSLSLELAQKQQDLDTVMETITRRSMSLLASDGGGVWLWREDDQELELAITYQVGEVDLAGRRLAPGEGLTGRAFAERTIQVVDHYPTWNGQSATFHDAPFVSGLAAPLIWQAQVVGVLVLTRSQENRPYLPDELNLAELLAAQAAAVIQNARLLKEARQRTSELQSLYETSLRLSTRLETTDLLNLIVEQAVTLLQAATAGFYLYEPQSDELVFSVATGYFAEFAGQRLKPGDGLAGRVFQERRPITVEDYQTWSGQAAIYQQEQRLTTLLGVPVVSHEAVLGVLDIAAGEGKPAFTERDIWLAELFAAQAATALENAHLFAQTQARAKELAILNEMGRTLSARLDVEAALYNVYRYVSRLMNSSNFYVAFYEPEADEISFPLVVENGQQIQWSSRRGGKGLTEYVIRTAEPLLIEEDVGGHIGSRPEGVEPIGKGAKSWLGVPLMVGEQVLGIIAVQSDDTSHLYTERHRDLLSAIAGQAAIAIQNARLFDEVADSERKHRLLLDSIQSPVLALSDEWDVLYCNDAYARFVDRTGTEMEGENLTTLFPEVRQTQSFQAYQRVLQTGEPEQVEGKVGNREMRASVYRTSQGILAIADDVTEEKQAQVERERLLAEAQALYRVSQFITSAQNTGEVLAAVLQYTRRLDLDRCLVALLDDPDAPPPERQVEVQAVWDAQGRESAFLGNRFSPAHIPLLGHIGPDDRILVPDFATAQNVDERTRATFQYLGVGAAVITPLTAGSRLLGWFLAETVGRSRNFDPQEVDALQSIAGQAAVAIQNLRQLETIRARARREQILREITTHVRASIDPDTVMRTAVRKLGAALGRPAFIRLGSAEQLSQAPTPPGEGDGRNSDAVPVEGGE